MDHDDWASTVAPRATELNSPAYALVQGIQTRYRESSYIDAVILEDPRALTEGYNPLVRGRVLYISCVQPPQPPAMTPCLSMALERGPSKATNATWLSSDGPGKLTALRERACCSACTRAPLQIRARQR